MGSRRLFNLHKPVWDPERMITFALVPLSEECFVLWGPWLQIEWTVFFVHCRIVGWGIDFELSEGCFAGARFLKALIILIAEWISWVLIG